MECPKCHYQNPGDHIFCGGCGAKLLNICPDCKAENPPPNKFCGKCGHNLQASAPPKTLSLDEKISKIQKYLPEGLTEKILSQRDRIEGEKKQVTVMFCDLEGFTKVSDAEAIRWIENIFS